jgi:hypothetical protein
MQLVKSLSRKRRCRPIIRRRRRRSPNARVLTNANHGRTKPPPWRELRQASGRRAASILRKAHQGARDRSHGGADGGCAATAWETGPTNNLVEAPLPGRSLPRPLASLDQQVTSMRVHAVPRDEFERQVESDTPPTITELARQGTKHQPIAPMLAGGRARLSLPPALCAAASVRATMQEALPPPPRIAGALPSVCRMEALRQNFEFMGIAPSPSPCASLPALAGFRSAPASFSDLRAADDRRQFSQNSWQ